MESIQRSEVIHEKEYESAFRQMLSLGVDGFTELKEDVPKTGFLKWLVEKKNYLLHGSNAQNIFELEPRLANCSSKEFGNMRAVYAVEDEVLTTFYAIKDHSRFQGNARSGVLTIVNDGLVSKAITLQLMKFHLMKNLGRLVQCTFFQEILSFKGMTTKMTQ